MKNSILLTNIFLHRRKIRNNNIVQNHTQQWFAKTIYSADSDEMAEYEKDLLQNSLNKKMFREYEKDQYHNKLLENIDKLIDIGIEIGDDGKYYFYNFAGNSQ